jgi:hypothetical protein
MSLHKYIRQVLPSLSIEYHTRSNKSLAIKKNKACLLQFKIYSYALAYLFSYLQKKYLMQSTYILPTIITKMHEHAFLNTVFFLLYRFICLSGTDFGEKSILRER